MNELINVSYQVKLEIKGYPKYIVANNRIFNRKTRKELRPKIYNGIEFYNLNGRKIRKDSLEFQRPEYVKCPF